MENTFEGGKKELAEILVDRIKREFPEMEWKNSRFVGHGWDNNVIILDEKIVFRFPKEDDGKEELKKEITLLDYLQDKVNLPVPKYKWIAKDCAFAGYEMIDGKALRPEDYEKMEIEEKNEIAKNIAEFFTRLHSLPIEEIRGIGVRDIKPESVLRNIEEAVKNKITEKVPKENVDEIEKFLPILKKTLESSFHPVFLHRDISESNVLVKDDKISGVIDFTDRAIGDPAEDFCRLWEFGQEFVKNVYEKYEGEKDPEFLERSKIHYKKTALWVLISACQGQHLDFEKGYNSFKKRFYS